MKVNFIFQFANLVWISGDKCLNMFENNQIMFVSQIWFGWVYLFNGISTPYRLFKAIIRFICKGLIVIITITSKCRGIYPYPFVRTLIRHQVFLSNKNNFHTAVYSPIGWDSRMHRLHLWKQVRHPQWMS